MDYIDLTNPKSMQKIREWAETEAKKTVEYKRLLSRSFKNHSKYPHYKEIALDLAVHLMCVEEGFRSRGKSDFAWNIMISSAYDAVKDPLFPVFAFAPDLVKAFLHTDLPKDVCSIKRAFRQALFLFPELVTSPDGYPIRWALVSHSLKDESFSVKVRETEIQSPPLETDKLRWVSQIERKTQVIYSSTVELREELETPVTGDIQFNDICELTQQDKSAEQQFLRTVDKLILQSMLYMQIKGCELVNFNSPVINFKKKVKRIDPKSPLDFIWIGKDYKPKSELIGDKGTHASPAMHWRRGHWRYQPIGEGRRDRKLIWIEPVLVNAGLNAEK